MDCKRAQDWLLQAEDPRAECCPADVADHVRRCPACGRLGARLARLEEAWRQQPLPAGAEPARAAFLKRLPVRPQSLTPWRHRLPRLTPPRWAVAALVFLTLGLSAWLLWPSPEVQASADVVEQLIDWDLQLSEAPTPAERTRIYARQAEALKEGLLQAEMQPEERDLAEKLLNTGSWLVEHDDPLDEADRFDEVADWLVQRMQSAQARGDGMALCRFARHYRRVAERGIVANLDRMEEGAVDGERQNKLDRLAQRDDGRAEALEGMLTHAPHAAHKDIRGALESTKKHHRHGKNPLRPRNKR
jgi:hypothetical protein